MGCGLHAIKVTGCSNFRVDFVAEGEEFLARSLRGNDRWILCTAHFGIGWPVLWGIADYLKQSGRHAVFIAGEDHMWQTNMNGAVLTPGVKVLVNARAALECGSIMCVAAENAVGSERAIYRNVFNFARLVRASIMFFWSTFDQNGRMVIHFVRPVHSTPKTNNDAEACFEEFGHFVIARMGGANRPLCWR
jgi:hypothetical protein